MKLEGSVKEGRLLRENRELFAPQIKKDKRFVNAFCYGDVRLIARDLTDENNYLELMYYFSDGFGGYNIEAVKRSLVE